MVEVSPRKRSGLITLSSGGGLVVPNTPADDATRRRLGRSVLFIFQQGLEIRDNIVRADVDTLLFAGRAMDFVSRLQGYGRTATPGLAREFARQAGLNERELCRRALPVLQQADVLSYRQATDGSLDYIEEYVGITAPVIDQTFRVLAVLEPSDAELAMLHSVEIASWAPLTQSQHLQQITQRNLSDGAAEDGLRLALATGINRRFHSADLNENVVFNPYVWGTRQVEMAGFLRRLPPAERDALFSIFQQASLRPGLALDQVTASSGILAGARKVGLIQAATVKSTGGNRSRTYVFSPLMQAADDKAVMSEALHLRKLFVAHILFGQEQAVRGLGRILNPTILVQKLLDRGHVGPATNIGTDYHLLEAAGVVRVEEVEGTGRAILRLIKREIVQGGLEWLEAGIGNIPATARSESVNLRRAPGSFVTPEGDRAALPDDDATGEIMRSALLALRKETQRAARSESAFPPRP